MFDHPAGTVGSERDVVGRRTAATLFDLLVVFAVFYTGQLVYLGGGRVPGVVSILGSLVWFVFTVFGLMPFFLFRQGNPLEVFLIAAGIWAVYATVFEWLFGQTVGKRLAGVVVVSTDGARPLLSAVLTRNALRVVDALVFYVVGFLVVLFTDRRQRVGDLVADTVVARAGTSWWPGME